jgi:tetratricopeptide (TPR) repeat protein
VAEDTSAGELAEVVTAFFDERAELAIEARVPTVEAMSLLEGPEAGVTRKELDLLLADRAQPRDAPALARLSLFGSRNGEVATSVALSFAATAMEVAPDDLESATYLIAALAEVGEYTDALAQLERTAAAHPDWGTGATANSWRGSLAYNLGDFAAAARAYSRAVRTDPRAINYLGLGDSFRRMEQNRPARDSYRKALRRDPCLEDALLGYLVLAVPQQSWLGSAVNRLLRSRGLTAPFAAALLGNSITRRLVRLPLRISHRRAPEQIGVRLALGLIALLDVDLELAESLLVPFTRISPSDTVGLGLATVVAIYSARVSEAVVRSMQMRLLIWLNSDGEGGGRFLRECFERLDAMQPRLAEIDTRECYEAALNVWPEPPEAQLDIERPWTLTVTLATHTKALAAAEAFRVGDLRQEEIELIVRGEIVYGAAHSARIAVYGQAESINVRWIEGDPLSIGGVRLGPAFLRIAIVEPDALDVRAADTPTARRGVDIREALARLLHWA